MSHELSDDTLVGYLLDALDEGERAQVDAQLQAEPESRWRLEQLQAALEPLAADKATAAPPAGLAVRTLARVAEFSCRELPRAPVEAARPAASRGWWRRADVLVAACLAIMALGLALPGLFGDS